jgi:LacI family transcriptional regulator
VLGAGNTLVHCVCHPPNISSVGTNYNLIGFKAAQALSRLMKNPVEHPNPILVPPVQIIERDSTGTPPAGDEALTRVLAFIREHAHENPTIEEMIRIAGMSRRSLENRFKKYLGRTPFDEVRVRQLERARKLLIETDHTLDEIAAMCGYSSSFYLSRLIHEKEGMPPRAFRKQFLRR